MYVYIYIYAYDYLYVHAYANLCYTYSDIKMQHRYIYYISVLYISSVMIIVPDSGCCNHFSLLVGCRPHISMNDMDELRYVCGSLCGCACRHIGRHICRDPRRCIIYLQIYLQTKLQIHEQQIYLQMYLRIYLQICGQMYLRKKTRSSRTARLVYSRCWRQKSSDFGRLLSRLA